MNLASTIIPKSDQLNADDLIAGPRTIKITDVRAGSSPEQPTFIDYEGGTGRPYKPCKSMRRLLIAIWGDESTAYIGRKLTLFRDPNITFGPDATGGIRISHASHIDQDVTMALTVTRGKRKPYTVAVLKEEAPIDVQALCDVGETKAREGKDALRTWWESLTPRAKQSLKDKLPAWKQLAA